MRKIVSMFTLLLLGTILAIAQSRPITGKVVDENGQPISGASVLVRGTSTGTSADANGNFRINAKTGDVLVVSGVGLPTNEVKIGGGSTLTVTLARQSQNLSEVVVTTALGVRRQAKELGYAATTVSGRELTVGKSVNVQQALNGKVSGLNISTVNSGVFENSKINIRGIRSLTGNNQPMLVIDGAPTPLGYLSSIPPDDVQDLTVLKSAASAAIYGPDAVNGVIVITTKRGGRTPTVTVSSSLEATRVAFFPKLQHDFGAWGGEGAPYIDQYGNPLNVPYENQIYGPRFDGSIKQIGRVLEDGTSQSGPYSNLHKDDKVKFWNSGLTFQNSVSIAAEDFYVGIQDAKIQGLVPDDKNRRTSLRFNGSKKYGNFSVNYGLNYILNNFDVVNEAGLASRFASAYNGSLFFLIMQVPDNVPLLDYKDWQNNKFAQYSNYFNDFAVNPYWVIGNIRQKGREDDLLGSLDVNYQLFPWLRASARVSSNLAFSNSKNTTAPIFVTDWARTHRSSTDYQNLPGNVFDAQSYSSRLNLDYYLSGEKTIASDFTFKYLAGGTIRQNRSKQVGVGGNNLVVPYLYNVSVRSGDANVPAGNNFDQTSSLLSAYGTFGLTFKGWASVEFTGRNDWDSRLLPQNRSFFYPAVNAAVVLTDAVPSLKTNTISYAKIRAAVSKSGNVNLNPYSLQATYSQPGGFPYGNVAGYTANQTIPNPNLKPEFVNTTEAGIELGFLKNRINLEATYFNQNNTDQILAVSQSATTGYTQGLANAASFKNYGVEMDLGVTPLINVGKGKINIRLNATYNNNKVTSTLNNIPVILTGTGNYVQVASGSPTVNNIAQVGSPAFQFQLSDYLRDTLGRVIVDKTTGLPSRSSNLITMGRTLPLWVVGITPSYTVGNFSVTMTWDYKGGHNFYAGMGSDEDFAGISARSAEYGRMRFVFPNSVYMDASGKYVPNTNISVNDGNAGFWTSGTANTGVATNYFSSAAAWRLRELNISYNLPIKWFGGSGFVKRVTVSAVGKNLFLLVPKSNQWGDPEFNYSTTGNTFGLSSSFQSPASRLFGGSVTVQF
jgi:TonB-linked SusC/RagA family outer membrane protein